MFVEIARKTGEQIKANFKSLTGKDVNVLALFPTQMSVANMED